MNAALEPLLFWHRLVVAYAIVLGIEAPALLFVALYKNRPRRELLLVAVPAGAFVWALWLARGIQATYDYWAGYWQFEFAHYPANFPREYLTDGVHGAVADATGKGWTVGVITTAALILGWGVALHWLSPPSAKRPRRPEQRPPAVSAGEDDLEITVEPIKRTGRTRAAG